jgi:glycosyltransferase involved in cell wall biosynthesis
MRVTIIAHDVGSKEMGMLYRPYYIGQGLKQRGHDIHFITASYSRVRRFNPEIKQDLETHEVEGLPYHWLKSLKFSGNSLQRAFGMLLFSFKLWWFAGYFAKKISPQVVVASSPHPLIIWGASRLAKKSRAKLIFEVRDIWPLSMHELSGMNPNHPFYILCQWAEDFAYKRSAKVISLLPYAYEHMKTRGLPAEKFVCIPNGFEEGDIKNKKDLPSELEVTLQTFKGQYPCIVGYAGAHGLANSLDALVEALPLVKNKKVGVVFIGDGAEKPRLQQKAKALGLHNVLFLNPIPKDQIPTLLEFFDIAYIGLKKSPLFKYGVSPNKLIDYMAMGRPVLYAIDTDRDPVFESGCGVKVPSDNPVALAEAITLMANMSQDDLSEMGKKGQRWVTKNLSYPQLLSQYEEVIR